MAVEEQYQDNEQDNYIKNRDKRDKNKTNSKVVIRRLPPSMTREEFLDQISPIPDHDYLYFCKPDLSLTPDLFSRAYISFVNTEDIYLFRDKFDDYIFLDAKGIEYPAIVEYAPFQRIPKKKRKRDPKSGTIESDPLYLEFLETLKEAESESKEPKMEYSYQPAEEKKEITSTPLLEFLASRKRDDRRRREDRQKRKPRIRGGKEDNIPEEEEEVKKIKPREKDKKGEDSTKVDEEFTEVKNQGKEKKVFDKKSDYEKRAKDGEFTSRKEKRERAKDAAKEKYKEKKLDSRKDKGKPDKKAPSYKQLDENETIDASSVSSKTFVNKNLKKKSEDVSKASEEVSEGVEKLKIDSTASASVAKVKTKRFHSKNDKSTSEETEEERRLLRSKSSEEKSQDEEDDSKPRKSKEDTRSERRIRNKDRPSIAIYKPGMGKFSKQRIGKDKDVGTFKSLEEGDSPK